MPIATTADLRQIAATVRTLRAERGWRQHELADAAQVGLRTVQTVEAGERRTHDSTYGRIARALDVSLARLLGEEA